MLETHIDIKHNDNKSHKCNLCKESFGHSSNLKIHMEGSHDMTRPNKCENCSKTFNSEERLNHHFARFHELRNCQTCPHCKKQFSRRKAHEPICQSNSNSERPRFQCQHCDKVYLDKGSLNKHLKKGCVK